MITNSDINRLRTFQATFLALLHAWLTGYGTGANKVDVKLKNYQSGSASFTMTNKSQNAYSFGAHLLPLLIFLTQFDIFAFFVYDQYKLRQQISKQLCYENVPIVDFIWLNNLYSWIVIFPLPGFICILGWSSVVDLIKRNCNRNCGNKYITRTIPFVVFIW